MADLYAHDFYEIPDVLSNNEELREAIIALVETQPIAGKVTEGGDRLDRFRTILRNLFSDHDFSEAVRRTEAELPRHSSSHSQNNHVFPTGWAERLVLTQYSRFYNQAVMEKLIAEDHTECHVPHSSTEDASSLCTQLLAGGNHDLQTLYIRLVQGYAFNKWKRGEAKIPNHPHCTHVVVPVEEQGS